MKPFRKNKRKNCANIVPKKKSDTSQHLHNCTTRHIAFKIPELTFFTKTAVLKKYVKHQTNWIEIFFQRKYANTFSIKYNFTTNNTYEIIKH